MPIRRGRAEGAGAGASNPGACRPVGRGLALCEVAMGFPLCPATGFHGQVRGAYECEQASVNKWIGRWALPRQAMPGLVAILPCYNERFSIDGPLEAGHRRGDKLTLSRAGIGPPLFFVNSSGSFRRK